jgi:protein MpaA
MLPRRADIGCDDRRVRGRRGVLAVVAVVAVALVGALPGAPAAAGVVVHQETVVVGTSVQGRDIVAVHRWADGATRPTMVIGSMHGDERAGSRVVRRLRELPLPDGSDLWLVPTMNPDGAAAGRRTNARGVDLNRNFPRHWVSAGAGTSKWSGPSPASEPETQAVMGLLRQVRPRTVVVVHQPLFGVDSYRAKSMTLVRRLGRELDLPVRSFDCHGGCHGTLTDWHNARLPGRAVTVELGARASDWRVRHTARGLVRVATPA